VSRTSLEAARDAEHRLNISGRAKLVNHVSFWEAIGLALGTVEHMGLGGDAGPLADYVAAVPLTRGQMLILADFLRLLPARMARGHRGEGKHKSRTDAHEVARQVKAAQRAWRQQNGRKRVPSAVTTQMIRDNHPRLESDVLRLLKNKSRL
jgi:hypothetical protein